MRLLSFEFDAWDGSRFLHTFASCAFLTMQRFMYGGQYDIHALSPCSIRYPKWRKTALNDTAFALFV